MGLLENTNNSAMIAFTSDHVLGIQLSEAPKVMKLARKSKINKEKQIVKTKALKHSNSRRKPQLKDEGANVMKMYEENPR